MKVKLTAEGCRARQNRLIELLEAEELDLAVVSDWRDVYYFCGAISEVAYPRTLILGIDASILVAEREFSDAAAVQQAVYSLQQMATLSFKPNLEMVKTLVKHLPQARRIGVQSESLLCAAADGIRERHGAILSPIDDAVQRMQAVKYADEIEVIRKANRLNDAGYRAVRQAIGAGATEAEVLAAGKAAVTQAAGCDCFYSGDFRCAAPGGFATDRKCRDGELYIVDAWINYSGYWSDNCRTFPVTTLDDTQRRAWELTEETVLEAEKMVQPGVSCRDVFVAMKELQDRIKPEALIHHGGHGVGLRNHEYPRINPYFDDVFEVNNVLTLEPGVYGQELRGGIRLECNYLLTETGVERLNDFPISICEETMRGG
jgi:Xaa-Pro dipeptidase